MMEYGNLTNRLCEGANYNKDKQIHENDDLTMYLYSDRYCYYVTKVEDQKHIFVKPYYVCADQDKADGMGHQEWKYFKSQADQARYLAKYFPDMYKNCNFETDFSESVAQEWEFRNNAWKRVSKVTPEKCNDYFSRYTVADDMKVEQIHCAFGITKKQAQKVLNGQTVKAYSPLSGKVSFGVKDYHYDWEF